MMLWKIFLLSLSVNAVTPPFVITTTAPYTTRITTHYPSDHSSLYSDLYKKWHNEINPFANTPYITISDHTYSTENGTPIYDVHYTTGELGLRIVPEVKLDLPKHLIVSGDSNTFGVGCDDNKTLPYYLSKKFPDHTVYNFGLGGTGPNSTLRFLEIFTIKNIAPLNYKKGAFILDFHSFLVQRIVGAKSYLHWGAMAPRYSLDWHDIPVYRGPFSESWQLKFYNFLDMIPNSETLFPDLPRIGESQIDLSARVILEIKKKYLEQTSPDNKFLVLINPESKGDVDAGVDKEMVKKLNELHVDVVTFDDKELLPLKHHDLDGHYAPEGHKNYAQMIFNKLKDKI